MNISMRNPNTLANIATWFSAVFLVAIGAAVAGYGDLRATSVVLAAMMGVFFLWEPSLLLWFVITGGLVLTGLTQLYVPQLQFLRWSIALLATLLGVGALCAYIFRHSDSDREHLPPIFWIMLAFVGVAVISGTLNYSGPKEFLFGFKGYFQVWGLFFALLLMGWPRDLVDRIPKALIAIALFQLPFALHQYFFLVPGRRHLGHGVVAEDVVAGTLGASAEGGGANAVLSILLLVAIAILVGLYKRRLLSPQRLLFGVLLLLTPIFFNANKIALAYLIVIYLMMFSKEIWRRPLQTLVIGIFAATYFFAILWSYSTILSRSDESSGWRSYIAEAIERDVKSQYGRGQYALNRWTSFTFWVHEHRNGDIDKVLLGHGIGASREAYGGQLEVSTVATRDYPGMGIGLTGVSAVLWDLGILGLSLLVGMLWATYRSAKWLAGYYAKDPWKSAVFEGLKVGLVILTLGELHQSSFVFHLPYQTFLLLIIGYVGYWHMKAMGEIRRARDAEAAVLAST